MSTTFEVYPGTDTIPTFRQVTTLASEYLQTFLRMRGIDCRACFSVAILQERSNERVPLDLDAPATWSEDQYAWFTIPGVNGGTDAYCQSLTRSDWDQYLISELEAKTLDDSWQDALQAALQIGYFWQFRCSAGQPGLIALGYGLLAGAVAELTGGFVFTIDGAWDPRRYPARPGEMLRWYFVPEATDDQDLKDWSTECLRSVREELAPGR